MSPPSEAQVSPQGLIHTPHELLTALVAERLDRLVDRMVQRGSSRLGIIGGVSHLGWLFRHIDGARSLPLVGRIRKPGEETAMAPAHVPHLPVWDLTDLDLPGAVDSVLIADDVHEEALWFLTLRHLPPGIIIHRLYERLIVGREALDAVPPVRPVVRAVSVRGPGVSAAAVA
jgi:hypothetical protein